MRYVEQNPNFSAHVQTLARKNPSKRRLKFWVNGTDALMHTEIKREFTSLLERRLLESSSFIQVVVGPRQVGKTMGLKQIVASWNGPTLMVSADSISPPTADWINLHWVRARTLGDNTLFVIDEIQKIPQWSEAIKRLYDEDRNTRKLQVVLLGSASLSLQKGLNESLAGRFELINATHWTYLECQEAFNWGIDEYLQFGGYPAAAELIRDPIRWQSYIRESIVEPVISRDIQSLVTVHKPALFRQSFELAMGYPAQEISLQKLLGQLQESGNATTIKHYLELFEGAFLLRCLQKYSTKALRMKASSPKILPMTSALVHAFVNPAKAIKDPEWRGRIFESSIGAQLSRTRGQLYYWRSGVFEVDFVVELEGKIYAIEVKSGRKKSKRGLAAFVKQCPDSIPIILDTVNGKTFFETKSVDEFLTGSSRS